MKICIAQTKPIKGNISANISAHVLFIELALTLDAKAIFFPELSLTGYEPELAERLAINQNDTSLDVFQEISNKNGLIIGIGLPTVTDLKVRISMIIFEPYKPRLIYSKQQLHSDEFPYFESGVGQVIIKTDDCYIAPAICYESLQPMHSDNAFQLGADVYLASVAKSAIGVEKAFNHYPSIAAKFSMPVLMSNCLGLCDNFYCVGRSSVWTKDGKLTGQLNDKSEGVLFFDTETEQVIERYVNTNHLLSGQA